MPQLNRLELMRYMDDGAAVLGVASGVLGAANPEAFMLVYPALILRSITRLAEAVRTGNDSRLMGLSVISNMLLLGAMSMSLEGYYHLADEVVRQAAPVVGIAVVALMAGNYELGAMAERQTAR